MLSLLWLLIAILAVLVIVGIIAIIVAAVTGSKNKQADYGGSYFDGGTLQLILWRIFAAFVTFITLGLAFPAAICMLQRWETKHTVINGRRLKFTGKGIQLFGRYILWAFLTIITFGIYSIWFGLGMKKWIVKHTVFADDDSDSGSYFTGGAGGWFVNHVLIGFSFIFTLGIATPWAIVNHKRWEAKHTVINGSSLIFKGTGGQLFVKNLIFILLTPLTLGIYAIFYPVRLLKWQYSKTYALDEIDEVPRKPGTGVAVVVIAVVLVLVIIALTIGAVLLGMPVPFSKPKSSSDISIYYPVTPEGKKQKELSFRENYDNINYNRTYNAAAYESSFEIINNYLENNYPDKDNGYYDALKEREISVYNNSSKNGAKYEITIEAVSEKEKDILVYNCTTGQLTEVQGLKYEGVIKTDDRHVLIIIVIVKDLPDDDFHSWHVNYSYEYVEKLDKNDLGLSNANTLIINTPEAMHQLTEKKAKELVNMENVSFLLYHFQRQGMIDNTKTYQMNIFADSYETCYAAKGINSVEDLKNYLYKYFTKEYVQLNYIDKQAGHWRIENNVIYFEPNWGMGENSMSTENIRIHKMGNNRYSLTSETEWSGPRTIYVTYEDGDYKIDVFNGSAITKEEAWKIISDMYELEHRTHQYFEKRNMLDLNKTHMRKIEMINFESHALKDIKTAEEVRDYLYQFCTPEYHLSSHSNPAAQPDTNSFMTMWFTYNGSVYVCKQYDYPWFLKEDTIIITKTSYGCDVSIQEYATGDPEGNPENEYTYGLVFEDGKYKITSRVAKNLL